MLPQNIFRLLGYFAVAVYLSSANADPAQESKAEAALAGKIKCEDFRKNPDGTWTSGRNAKIGSNPFSNLTFESKRVTVGGADLATARNTSEDCLRTRRSQLPRSVSPASRANT
jgi:hypothetical protein